MKIKCVKISIAEISMNYCSLCICSLMCVATYYGWKWSMYMYRKWACKEHLALPCLVESNVYVDRNVRMWV